ncbi:MAG: septum formation initiator family protein [Acidobacteriota bacterium]
MSEEHQQESARRPWRVLAYLVVGALVLLLALAVMKGYRDLDLAREKVRELEDREAAARQRVEELEERLRRVRGEDAALEELAREELGLARPGDIVLVLPEAAESEEGSGGQGP